MNLLQVDPSGAAGTLSKTEWGAIVIVLILALGWLAIQIRNIVITNQNKAIEAVGKGFSELQGEIKTIASKHEEAQRTVNEERSRSNEKLQISIEKIGDRLGDLSSITEHNVVEINGLKESHKDLHNSHKDLHHRVTKIEGKLP